jgi:HD-GYP domain-containing protein (c-di-GMP phosphodiesterase class II)
VGNNSIRNDSALGKVCQQAVDALIAAAAERDKTAKGHSERVADYSVLIARKIGLSEEEIGTLRYAASLHDIGKIAISSKILNKLGRLTPDEISVMRTHSLVALRILEKIEGFEEALPIVRHHHERWDGAGYPDGLSGNNIPIGARIVAVAETYDILTSDVPWRNAYPHTTAMAEIESCSGTQFDTAVVAAFKAAIDDMKLI